MTELVTPGVSFNDQVLEQGKNNFLCSVYFGKSNLGVAFLDVSTGEFLVAQGDKDYIDKLLSGFSPSEIIYQKIERKIFKKFSEKNTTLSAWKTGFLERSSQRNA